MISPVLLSYFIAFTLTFLAGFGLLATKSLHGRFTYDQSQGVQRFHEDPTPRIGGLALVFSIVGVSFEPFDKIEQTHQLILIRF